MLRAIAQLAVILAYAVVVMPLSYILGCIMGVLTPDQHLHSRRPKGSTERVAVIGGGIAGTSAAWTLSRSGQFASVHLFERRSVLGGNAKTFAWPITYAPNERVPFKVSKDSTNAERTVRTGLSVLAWPPAYFKNYESLLKTFSLGTDRVVPRFFVAKESEDGPVPVFKQGEPNYKWKVDMVRWDRAVTFVRIVSASLILIERMIMKFLLFLVSGFAFGQAMRNRYRRCNTSVGPSMYEVCVWNPLNVIPAKFIVCTVFRVSQAFWDDVVVAVYSSSFLTTELNGLPSMILPPLDDIISVGTDQHKTLHTWHDSSKTVFDRMAADILNTAEEGGETSNKIMLGVDIISVNCFESSRLTHTSGKTWVITFIDRATGQSHKEAFAYVVFACSSVATNHLTNTPHNRDVGFRNTLFENIIPGISYENERDVNFLAGHIHSNRDGLPLTLRDEVLSRRFTNYIEHRNTPTGPQIENVFIFSTWVPEAIRGAKAVGIMPLIDSPSGYSTVLAAPPATATSHLPRQDQVFDMYVSYNPSPSRAGLFDKLSVACRDRSDNQYVDQVHDLKVDDGASSTRGVVDNSWAHPQLNFMNLTLSFAMPMTQGHCGAHYCGSYATPGNGHDLSLLSGIVVASEIIRLSRGDSADVLYYPFEEEYTKEGARSDFFKLRNFMLRR